MGLTLVFGACWWWLFRSPFVLAPPGKIDARGEIEQECTHLLMARGRETCPFGVIDGNVHTLGRVGDLGGEVLLRDGFIDVGVWVARPQGGHHDGVEIEGHQGQTEAEQGCLGVAQGIDLGVEMSLQFLKGGLDGPAGALSAQRPGRRFSQGRALDLNDL